MSPSSACDQIHIAVLAAHAVVRAGFKYMLRSHSNINVIGEASTIGDAVLLIKRHVDVTVIDPDSGEVTLDAIAELNNAGSCRLLVLTAASDARLHKRAFELGAVGVVQKDEPTETLVRAIVKVHAGELWLDNGKAANLLRAILRPRDPEDAKIQMLTRREREVITFVGRGLKNAAIAERLFISAATVRNHLTSILSKLELTNRFELAVYSFRKGLVENKTGEPFEFGASSRFPLGPLGVVRRTERM